MKERLLTLAFACGALFLFYALLFPKPTPRNEQLTQPLSTERGPNGYFALRRWLEGEHVPLSLLRERYEKLADVSGPERGGNLLITTMPHRLRARPNETIALQEWIAEGNTLLVMAGLADTPDWVMDGKHDFSVIDDLKQMTGIKFSSAREDPKKEIDDESQKTARAEINRRKVVDALQKLLKPEARQFEPAGTHPLMAGVSSLAAISEFPADDWKAQPADTGIVVEVARIKNAAASAMWLVNYGKGQIVVSGFASPFTNKLIGQHDNARLLSNIVAWSVSSSGKVIIDDAHQGSVAFYDPQAFFGDARLHRALGWLVLLWLVFVLGPTRLRSAHADWHPIDIVSFVRATGGFMARTLRPAEASRRALILFFNGIRRRLGLPENGEPVWEWLEDQGKVARADIVKLRGYYQSILDDRRVDFIGLHNLLKTLKGNFV